MSKFLAFGDVNFPTAGSTEITERVKHFENDISFGALQIQINLWLEFVKSPAVVNRPSIRSISYSHYIKPINPNKDTIIYLAQIHYMLIGDADDAP